MNEADRQGHLERHAESKGMKSTESRLSALFIKETTKDHGWMLHQRFTLLQEWPSHPDFKVGDTVRVVMVSRLGDVGVTKDLNAEYGYQLRVYPEHLKAIRSTEQGRTP